MKKIIFILLVLLLIAADAPPQLPSSFWGQVSGIAAGSTVNVWREGVKVASTTVIDYPGYGLVYAVNVPGAAEDENKILTFRSKGVKIGEGVWHSGTNVQLDLMIQASKKLRK